MTKNTDSDRVAYPALPEPLQTSDLVRLFTPTSDEINWANSVTRSEHTRCHVLTLLKVFQTLGRFIAIAGIPHTIVGHVARCVGLPEAQANEISGSRPTLYRHQHLVRAYVGVSKWDASAQRQVENTIEALASIRTHPADLLNGALEMLLRERVELPALSTLRRIAGNVVQRVHDRLLQEIHGRLAEQDRERLDELLNVPADDHESMFAALCRSPGRATRRNLRKLIDRWHWLQSLVDPTVALAGIAPAKIEQWSDEGRRLTAAELSEYRAPRRHALLLSVIYLARGRLLDDLVTMLTKIMLKLQHRAQALLEAWQSERREASESLVELLRTLVGAYQSAEQPAGFHRAASAVLDEAGGAEHVMARCSDRLQHRSGGWPAFTDTVFRSQRAVLLDLIDVLPLKAMPGADNLLEALNLVVSCRSYREEWVQAQIDTSFLPRQWRKRVRGESKSELYHRRNLEIAVCFALAKR